MITIPDPGTVMTPVTAVAWSDQARAAGREAGGQDVLVTVDPKRGQQCGHGGCPDPATKMILLLDRPGLEPGTAMQSCAAHESELWLMYGGLEPPAPQITA